MKTLPYYDKIAGMRFIENLYLGEMAGRKAGKLKRKIKKGSLTTGAYVLCLPDDPAEPVEFFQARLLRQDYYKRHEPLIIGLAADEDEAIELVSKIVKDCIVKTGSLRLRQYTESLT